MDNQNEIYDWHYLKSHDCKIMTNLKNDWEAKLNNKNLKECDYHSFLSEHSGLFLGNLKCLQVISKLKLGSDYETDFIVIKDNASVGPSFGIIEIESPHTNPYKKNGNPSSRLTTAIQQILNWKTWINENRNLFSKMLLPTEQNYLITDRMISNIIIIGRREDFNNQTARRNELANALNICIRSFDYLTDKLNEKYFDLVPQIYSNQMNKVSEKAKNDLANPFYKATKDSDWKLFCREIKHNYHYFAHNHEAILKYRVYNDLLNSFKAEYHLNLNGKHGTNKSDI